MCVTDDGLIIIRGYKPCPVQNTGGWFQSIFGLQVSSREGPAWIHVYRTPHHKVTKVKCECEHSATIVPWVSQGKSYLAEACYSCYCIRVYDVPSLMPIHTWGPAAQFGRIVRGTHGYALLVITEENKCFSLEWMGTEKKLKPDASSSPKTYDSNARYPAYISQDTRDIYVQKHQSGRQHMERIIRFDHNTITCMQCPITQGKAGRLDLLWSLNTESLKVDGNPLEISHVCSDSSGRVYAFSDCQNRVIVVDGTSGRITQIIMDHMMTNCRSLQWCAELKSIVALYDTSNIDVYKVVL